MKLPSRRAGLIVAAAWILMLHRPGPASAAGDDPLGGFDAYAAAALEDWKTPAMALTVVKDGRVVFARGYGVRKLGRNAAVDANTVFPIASITDATIGDDQKSRDAENARLDRDRRAHVKPRVPLSHYAGTYKSDLFGRLVVKEVDGTLLLELGPNCRAALAHWSGDRFRVRFLLRFPEDWFISFVLEGGHVVKVTIANVFSGAEMATFTRLD